MKALDQYINEALVKNHIVINNNYVDFKLPSGNLWATCNLGANSPEEYGNYYMWASYRDNSKDNCCWENVPFNDGEDVYSSSALSFWENKFLKNNILLPSNDAANIELKSNWFIPTEKDFEELLARTNYRWTTYNDVKGYMFTAGDEQMFIPAAGFRYDNTTDSDNLHGKLWSSTLNPYKGWLAANLTFGSGDILMDYSHRCNGLSIRPILKK